MSTKQDHPDSNLFPHATGLAQKIVDDHQTEQPLKLYSGWFCPFVQRAWTVLEEKKIPYQYIEVNPYHKPDSLLKLNPRGLVPTLQYDDKPLYESTVICEFLEDAYPDHGPHLLPKDPFDRARTRIWTDFCTSRIIPAFHRFLQFQPMTDEEGLEEARSEFLAKLKEFAKEMDREGPFFLGEEPSLIDFVVAPWMVSQPTTADLVAVMPAPSPMHPFQSLETVQRWWRASLTIHTMLDAPMGVRPLQRRSRNSKGRRSVGSLQEVPKGTGRATKYQEYSVREGTLSANLPALCRQHCAE